MMRMMKRTNETTRTQSKPVVTYDYIEVLDGEPRVGERRDPPRQRCGHPPHPRGGADHRRPAVPLVVEHATPGPTKGLGVFFFVRMRPKGEPAIRTAQGHAPRCRPCPTMTGASNKSRENRLDLPGFLRKPEQISRFSRHRAPDGATASHALGLDGYGHAPKERPPWAGAGGFRRKAHRVPPRRTGSAPALR